MSEQKVEIFLAAVEAFNRQDWDAALGYAGRNFELDFTRAIGPLHGVFGRDEMTRFWRDFIDEWESFRLRAEDIVEVGDHLVVSLPVQVVGRDGVEVISRPAYLCTFRDAEIVRLSMFQEYEEALAAAGGLGDTP